MNHAEKQHQFAAKLRHRKHQARVDLPTENQPFINPIEHPVRKDRAGLPNIFDTLCYTQRQLPVNRQTDVKGRTSNVIEIIEVNFTCDARSKPTFALNSVYDPFNDGTRVRSEEFSSPVTDPGLRANRKLKFPAPALSPVRPCPAQ